MSNIPENLQIHTEELALFSQSPVNVAEDKITWNEIRPSYIVMQNIQLLIFLLLEIALNI